MTLESWLLYMVAVVLTCLTPGPATLLPIVHAVRYGRAEAAITTAGCVTATSILAIVSALGLGTLVLAMEELLQIIKWGGALYLIWLGADLLLFRKGQTFETQEDRAAPLSARRLFLKGFVVSITNPKALIFFTALFPLFLDAEKPVFDQLLIMWLSFMPISFVFIFGYGVLAEKSSASFFSGHRMNWFNRLSGSLFILLGLGLSAME